MTEHEFNVNYVLRYLNITGHDLIILNVEVKHRNHAHVLQCMSSVELYNYYYCC